MLKIKLSRRGKKKKSVYRILVLEGSKDPYGDYLENVGTYNPRTEPRTIELKEDRIKHWLSKGAQPTDTVHNLLVDAGIIQDKKRSVSKLGKKFKAKLAEAEEAKKAPKKEKPAEEAKAEESSAKESKPEEKKEEPKSEEKKEEKPAEESKPEEKKEDAPAESPEPAEATE